jgi:hypothetical protein
VHVLFASCGDALNGFLSFLWNSGSIARKPMRKSREVPLTLLAAVALAAIGCHDEPRHCVDAQSHLMPDSACQMGSGGSGIHYVYGGSSGGRYGDTVVGASVSRGGFGHGGGEGGE